MIHDPKHQFYPTPKKVIKQMIQPYLEKYNEDKNWRNIYYFFQGKNILEPSAGKGDIIEYIKENHSANKIDAIEIDPVLHDALKVRTNVVHDNFLTFETDKIYDYIFMNPPFVNGDEHLLKAWEIAQESKIACLLNAETINNPYTKRRQILVELIKKHGKTKFIGKAFKDSENTTEVEVVIVWLEKPHDTKFDFDFDLKGEEKSFNLNEETIKNNSVAVNDIIGSMLISYEQLKEDYVELLRSVSKVKYRLKHLIQTEYSYNPSESFLENIYKDGSNKHKYSGFSESVKMALWNKILRQSGVEKYMTTRIQKNFDKYIKETSTIPLTKENIYKVIHMIVDNSEKILEQAIIDAFDQMTRYADNRIEGSWKHNDSWKVNKKIILPYYVKTSWDNAADRKSYGFTFSINWNRDDISLCDIDKALCYITGKRYSFMENNQEYSDIKRTRYALEQKMKHIGKIWEMKGVDTKCESTFFTMKFHLSGTVHLTFKDPKLLEELNYRAALYKKWIRPTEYDEWKAKRNGEKRIPKSRRLKTQQTLF